MTAPSQDQHVEKAWTTPTQAEIPEISRAHVAAMEQTTADEVWVRMGLHHVILQTTGRRSGEQRKVALPVWIDPDGHRIVVASFAGADHHPAWFLNLQAQPAVHVTTQHGNYACEAEILDKTARHEAWQRLLADRPFYREYEDRTDRVIPLVRLAEPAT